MEEDIKLIEEHINHTKNEMERIKFVEWYSEDTLKLLTALENLIKGYRELQTKYNEFKEEYNEMYEDCAELQGIYHQHVMRITTLENLVDNSIPKSKIKEKIQELTNMRDTTITSEGYNILNGEIVVLQELMEDK